MQLLERDAQVEILDAALGRVHGAGRIVLIAGEAGIGKTSLVQQFASAPGGAARVLWGGCEALFTPHPLAPLHDIARQIGGGFPAAIAAAATRHDIFNLTLDQFGRLPERTVVIFEDVHWADEATLDLLKFLGRRLRRLGLLLVVTYRDDEVGEKHPLRSVLGDLPAGAVSRVQLPPLSEAAVGVLAQAAGRSPAGVHEVTGGNPFFVTEVLASGEDAVPATVRDAVIVRVSRLSPAARKVAHLVSIVPGKTERWLVDQTIVPTADVLQECLDAGMVVSADYSLGFRHELARRAVEDGMPREERRALHALALAALLTFGEDKVAVARLVHHADNAADSAAVLRLAPLAAERAAKMGAHREAAVHFKTALRHGATLDGMQRATLLDRLSYECYLTDQIAEAIAAREQALALWRAAGVRVREGDTMRWLSRLTWFNGDRARAVAYASDAVRVLETLPHGRELAMTYSNCAQLYMLAEQVELALDWGRKAIELATTLGDDEILSHALNNIGGAKLTSGDATGLDDLLRSLRIALDGGYEEHAARAYTNLGAMLNRHRDYEPAVQHLKDGIAYCEERDLDSWVRYMTAHRAEAGVALGRWDEAAKDAGLVINHPRVATVSKIPALTTLGLLRIRRGDPDGHAVLAEALKLAIPTAERQRLGPVLAALAEAAWLHGTASSEIFDLLEQTFRACGSRMDIWIQGELAFWLWRHGRLAKAPRGIAEPFALQIAGDWRNAAAAWATIGCPYERAVALADSDDETTLREALTAFEGLGASPMAARVRRKLRAGGVRAIPRGAQKRHRQNPCGITTKELNVLALLVEGCRNAEIARRLFVSEKTVDHHVSAILAKLEVRSRGEAAAAALRLGLCEPRMAAVAGKK